MKRYDLDIEACDGESGFCRAEMTEDPTGDYVLYSDVSYLLSLLREARDILDRYRTGRLPSYAEPPTWKLTDDLLSRLDSALKEAGE